MRQGWGGAVLSEGTSLLHEERILRLATDTEFLDDGTIALDVHLLEVVEHTATLTDDHLQSALRAVVLLVLLQVTRQVRDAEGEEGDLAFRATRVRRGLTILFEELGLLS